MNGKLISFLIASTFACSACSSLNPPMTWIQRWGDPASLSAATRTIYISPATAYVNVVGGETIQFIEGEKSFAWNFDGPGGYTFDLAKVAPAGALDHRVEAYVDPDPYYSGR